MKKLSRMICDWSKNWGSLTLIGRDNNQSNIHTIECRGREYKQGFSVTQDTTLHTTTYILGGESCLHTNRPIVCSFLNHGVYHLNHGFYHLNLGVYHPNYGVYHLSHRVTPFNDYLYHGVYHLNHRIYYLNHGVYYLNHGFYHLNHGV